MGLWHAAASSASVTTPTQTVGLASLVRLMGSVTFSYGWAVRLGSGTQAGSRILCEPMALAFEVEGRSDHKYYGRSRSPVCSGFSCSSLVGRHRGHVSQINHGSAISRWTLTRAYRAAPPLRAGPRLATLEVADFGAVRDAALIDGPLQSGQPFEVHRSRGGGVITI